MKRKPVAISKRELKSIQQAALALVEQAIRDLPPVTQKVWELIRTKPTIKPPAVAKAMGMSLQALEPHLVELRNMGLIPD